MSDVPEIDAAGLPEELSAVDQLLHRGEANPRTRSGIMGVELLDADAGLGALSGPASRTRRARCCACGRRSSCRRCRRPRRAGSSTPTSTSTSTCDAFGCPRRARCARCWTWPRSRVQSPMDISRPLWTATLVEGLADGKRRDDAAPEPRGHRRRRRHRDVRQHLRPRARSAAGRTSRRCPSREDLSPNDLMRGGLQQAPRLDRRRRPRRDRRGGVACSAGPSATRCPRSAAWSTTRRSSARVMGPVAEPSPAAAPTQPVVAHRGDRHRVRRLCTRRRRRRAVPSTTPTSPGCAEPCGCYHEGKGIPVATLPMAVPVNLRSDDDPAGGNRFAGVNLAAPIGVVDPTKRIQKVRKQMMSQARRARDRHGRRHGAGDQPAARRDPRVGGRLRGQPPTSRPATCPVYAG